ncbi:hypothetical protein SAMN02910317_02671 [Ruminococcaceae bacterium FB2012]|nr:hypothetical protein SAMN02910317_02671 [Ruminococcaceae bacterium FB2012]
MDFIFIIGAPAVGKTTLAKELYKKLGGAYIEQNAVPEFEIPPFVKDAGICEEQVCWGCLLRQAEYFRGLGFHNIVILDFDDLRARELPLIFKGQSFMILRLVSSDIRQLLSQMDHRRDNEGGLYDPEMAESIAKKHLARPMLPNEVSLDVSGRTKEQVLEEAYMLVQSFEPKLSYEYELDDINNYYSWVQSRGLH